MEHGDWFASDCIIRHAVSGLRHSPGMRAKKPACRGDAPLTPAPERAQMSSFAASLRYSLRGRGIRCRCLLLGERDAGWRFADIAAVRGANPAAQQYERPSYSMFSIVLCECHSSGISMCRVTASAVRLIGCRPSTMDSTISGARKAKRIRRPT